MRGCPQRPSCYLPIAVAHRAPPGSRSVLGESPKAGALRGRRNQARAFGVFDELSNERHTEVAPLRNGDRELLHVESAVKNAKSWQLVGHLEKVSLVGRVRV